MFGLRYFARRFFGGRFFGPAAEVGLTPPPLPEPTCECPCTEETATEVTALAAETATAPSLRAADAPTEPEACANAPAAEMEGCFGNARQTYTASCPYGFSGEAVTIVVEACTVFSGVSRAEANARALHNATVAALAALTCTNDGYGQGYYPPVGAGQLHE